MNFYKNFFLLSQCIFFSCKNYKTIAKCENLVKEQWNRKEVLQNELKVEDDQDKVSFVVDVFYGDDVQYQNIFLKIKIKDEFENIVFEKEDIMLMLFDASTGVPLGRKIFREQHLEFLIDEGLKIQSGIYKIEISQMTRADNLYGIKKIETKLCSL